MDIVKVRMKTWNSLSLSREFGFDVKNKTVIVLVNNLYRYSTGNTMSMNYEFLGSFVYCNLNAVSQIVCLTYCLDIITVKHAHALINEKLTKAFTCGGWWS